MLSNIGQEVVARFGISTPVVPAGPHTVIFQNKEESSCPHSYYARLQLKRIFVRKVRNEPQSPPNPLFCYKKVCVFKCGILIHFEHSNINMHRFF